MSARHLNDIENMKCEVLTDTLDAISAATGITLLTCSEEECEYITAKVKKHAKTTY